ncbi:quorum-sensing-regulated virulence factor family protein [Entomomonas sp. E2T0]|uniref:quorum-sensing-regulated virulence factor family protein n=1 Tax=Entomomonas sp. E2T0 TaxID=2930213 RepID=UPI002228471B|nr:quorum-sensing-regulated virulence factor family protein [Entomomonas sp. E2T0]UYZ83983.1 quorum-sensing-regulated virulence factor family protein [Entomomonas sp. E2T0]
MIRKSILIVSLALPFMVNAASLKDYNLHQTLQTVAKKSSEGIPRKINDDLTDKGYTVQDNTLINRIEVSDKQAEEMRKFPNTMRSQLAESVCKNEGYRDLLKRGAILSYQFTEKGNKPIAEELFFASDCGL